MNYCVTFKVELPKALWFLVFLKPTWKPGSHVWTPEDRLMSKLSFR